MTPQGTIATVVLDDVDITDIAISGSFTRRLNRISTATCTVNMQELALRYATMFPGPGSYLKIYFENSDLGTAPVLYFHGRVMNCEVSCNEQTGYVVFNASDPLELWQARPVRDSDGDFSLPSIIEDFVFAPSIIQAALDHSESAGSGPPTDAEGPTRLQINSVAGGTISMVGAPTDWPMTIAELAALLTSTGLLDCIVTPIEFDVDDNYGQLDLYNGDFGQDLTSSVAFQYGMGAFNVRALRWNQDMTGMCNKLWYYLGPRVGTEDDPPGDQHWQANIQGDDPGLAYPPGGQSVPPCDTGPTGATNPIGELTCSSREEFDVRMDIQIFDAKGDEAIVAHNLYRRLWQIEQYLRAQPRTLVHVTPTRDTAIGEFDIGDLVLCEASSEVLGGFSGAQRIYEYTISWDEDSVAEVGELQVSSDQEGFDT
jgi:hypothetical protein